MAKKQKKKVAWKRIVIGVVILLLMIGGLSVASVYVKTKSIIEKLPLLSTVAARDYKLTENVLYKGQIEKCTDWNDPLYGSCYKSPYFPYKRLEEMTIRKGNPVIITSNGKEIDKSTETRLLLKDPKWKVYWIYSQTGYGPERLYGPFQENL